MVRNTLAGAVLAPARAPGGARGQAAPGPGSLSASENARYRAEAARDAMVMLGQWQNAWTRDDVRTLSRLYDADALLRLPGQPAAVQGRAAVEELLRARLPAFGSMEVETIDVEVGDELLYLFHRYTIAPPGNAASGPAALFAGNCTTVLERDANSGWRIRAQTFEPPAAPPAAASAGAPPR
jgi:ketosteroid isomerase-like protein